MNQYAPVHDLPPASREKVFQELCDVLGPQLDRNPRPRWYNYIQMFSLRRK
ncbi:MAG: hypothetical protein ACLFV7_00640 [Phycisphaerae bacterium]